jgi:hypothetical protein
MTIAAAEFGMIGSLEAQSSNAKPANVPQIKPGTSASVICSHLACFLTFEHDTGEVTIIQVAFVPKVWAGERCRITLTRSDRWYSDPIHVLAE